MQTVALTLPQSGEWQGLKTKYSFDNANVTTDNFLIGSKNLSTTVDGGITKRPGGSVFNTSALSSPIKDQYEAVFADGSRHLIVVQSGTFSYSSGGALGSVTGGTGFTAAGNFEFASYQDRVYAGNGIDDSIVYDKTVVYGGVTYTGLPKIKVMGAQAPSSAPTAPATGSGAAGSVPNGVHHYKVTYLYYGSEESNGSTASGACTVTAPASTVALTAIPVGGYGVTARKIYRDNNDGLYLLVGTISDNTTTVFSDTASVGTAVIPSSNNVPPKFAYVLTWHDRIFVAGIPSLPFTLQWSDPGLPDIFNPFNTLVCNPKDPIMALYVYNDRVLVFNRHSIGQILGSTSATFQYSEITNAVGCVDGRSIQTRTSTGVPTVMWLADKGFYQFNGSSIEYISDDIEDQMTLNIQQGSATRGRHTDDTDADFNAGTKSASLTVTGGQLSTLNPVRRYATKADWETTGVTIDNIATLDDNTITLVPPFAALLGEGTVTGDVTAASGIISLPVYPALTGQSGLATANRQPNGSLTGFTLSSSAHGLITVTSIRAYGTYTKGIAGTSSSNVVLSIRNSDGSLVQQIFLPFTAPSGAGTKVYDQTASGLSISRAPSQTFYCEVSITGPDGGATIVPSSGSMDYVDTMDTMVRSGNWRSVEYDTHSLNPQIATFTVSTATAPSGCSNPITIYGRTVSGGSLTTLTTFNGPNSGALNFTVNTNYAFRYIVIDMGLTSTIQTNTPTLSFPTINFALTGTWTSQAIETTVDVTTLLTWTGPTTVPAGTTVTFTVATSADNITYSSYVAIGSATPARWAKIRITLTTNNFTHALPVVTSAEFDWRITGTFSSQEVNIGYTPAGWSLFIPEFVNLDLTNVTLTWSIRSGASQAALEAASYTAISPNAFINVTVAQWVQWKVVIVVGAPDVQPVVEAVTLNWLITNQASIRVASLFFDRKYYMAVATYGSTYNNVLYKYDHDNTWQRDEDLAINTFSLFFNDPYYGSSIDGKLILFLTATTDFGTNVTMDIRVPLKVSARQIGDLEDKVKILRDVTCTVLGTGATYLFYYSVDQGETWHLMQNVSNGLQYFTPANDSKRHFVRMVPVFTMYNVYASNRSILLRIVEASAFTSEVRALKAHLWIRGQEVVDDING